MKALVLYAFEGCPWCRRVRLAIEDLGLATEIRPCPKGGTRFRPEAAERAGRAQFPFLVDPNTGAAVLESLDIVTYLYETYGEAPPPPHLTGPRFVLGALRDQILGDPDAAERRRLCLSETPYLWEPGAPTLSELRTE